ncbi:MAG TPA: WcaI family glycosyltransferase [Bryobacteraceae bacterium]|jgi:putative colanic acid biosynthesis glycosyltransferase WcaI|nr:WcaI family glycosyltransferase [Bryobacteraceae bacterium]
MRRRLRILNHHIFYAPEPVGVAAYAAQMCAWLARQGHEVRVVCPPPYYPFWRVQQPYKAWRYQTEILDGVHVTRCPIWIPAQPRGLARVLYAASFALSSLPALAGEIFRRPDVVFVTEPSFLNAIASLAAARCCGALAWMHVQDFELDIALGPGRFRSRWPRRLARLLESSVMRRFDVVSTISSRMMERLGQKGVPEGRRVFFPNWVDTAGIFPMEGPSPLRRELGFPADAVVALYSGSMGAKQGITQLIDAARLLSGHPRVRIVICGDGAGLASSQALAADLPNVSFLPLQPEQRLNALLNLADLHVLPQKPSFADLVMPSKMLGMLASGRPVVATANAGTELASIVSECGVVVPPENPGALAAAIASLAEDPSRRAALGAQARAFVSEHFRRDAVLGEFESKLCSAAA